MSTPSLESIAARIVGGSPDGILLAVRDGVIRIWNAGAEAILGWTSPRAGSATGSCTFG